jgi:hypothetical protein
MQIELSADTQTRLNALLDYIGTTAKDADGFVREQAPLVAQEIVAWEFWMGLTQAVVGGISLVVVFGLVLRAIRNLHKHGSSISPEQCLPHFFVAFVLLMVALPLALCGTPRVIKSTISPRLVVIDYIKAAK